MCLCLCARDGGEEIRLNGAATSCSCLPCCVVLPCPGVCSGASAFVFVSLFVCLFVFLRRDLWRLPIRLISVGKSAPLSPPSPSSLCLSVHLLLLLLSFCFHSFCSAVSLLPFRFSFRSVGFGAVSSTRNPPSQNDFASHPLCQDPAKRKALMDSSPPGLPIPLLSSPFFSSSCRSSFHGH